jgi:hypothetical protein
VLLFDEDDTVHVGYCAHRAWRSDATVTIYPTHWMRLPLPPNAKINPRLRRPDGDLK